MFLYLSAACISVIWLVCSRCLKHRSSVWQLLTLLLFGKWTTFMWRSPNLTNHSKSCPSQASIHAHILVPSSHQEPRPFSQTHTHTLMEKPSGAIFFNILLKDIFYTEIAKSGVDQRTFWFALIGPPEPQPPRIIQSWLLGKLFRLKLTQLLRAAVVEWGRQWKKRGCNRTVNKAVNHKIKKRVDFFSKCIPSCRNVPLF